MSGWAGIFIVLAATLLGIIVTLLAKKDPGGILGAFLVLGTIVAGFGIHYRAAYLLIPTPALLYVVAALVTGYVHDRSLDTSHAALAIHAAEWVGAGFLWMCAGTIAAIAITAGRWLWERRSTLLNRGHASEVAPRTGPARSNGRPPGRYPETADYPRPDRRGPARPAGRPEAAAGGTRTYPRSAPPPLPAPPAGRPSARPSEPTSRPGAAPAAPPASGSGSDDPFRRYYDDGETWR